MLKVTYAKDETFAFDAVANSGCVLCLVMRDEFGHPTGTAYIRFLTPHQTNVWMLRQIESGHHIVEHANAGGWISSSRVIIVRNVPMDMLDVVIGWCKYWRHITAVAVASAQLSETLVSLLIEFTTPLLATEAIEYVTYLGVQSRDGYVSYAKHYRFQRPPSGTKIVYGQFTTLVFGSAK